MEQNNNQADNGQKEKKGNGFAKVFIFALVISGLVGAYKYTEYLNESAAKIKADKEAHINDSINKIQVSDKAHLINEMSKDSTIKVDSSRTK